MLLSLPFAQNMNARRVSAPFHFTVPGMRHCMDFYLPMGTNVLAAQDGVVTARESRFNKNYREPAQHTHANHLTILHDDGAETWYAHLGWRSITVRKGERVRRGQIIARSGDTGYATYPHLHFGLYDGMGKNVRMTFSEPLPPKIAHQRLSRV